MIVICGDLQPLTGSQRFVASIAGRAAHDGAVVQVVGIVPDGIDGDAQLLKLAASGIGHAAVLRTWARPLEGADLELALRYLPDVRVIVGADLESDALAAVVDAAAFIGAILVVVGTAPAGIKDNTGLPDSAVVLQAPARDLDGTFAGFVAAFAVRLDAGEPASDAWDATMRALAVDVVSPGVVRGAPPAAR